MVADPRAIGPALDRAFSSGVPYVVNVLTDTEAAELLGIPFDKVKHARKQRH